MSNPEHIERLKRLAPHDDDANAELLRYAERSGDQDAFFIWSFRGSFSTDPRLQAKARAIMVRDSTRKDHWGDKVGCLRWGFNYDWRKEAGDTPRRDWADMDSPFFEGWGGGSSPTDGLKQHMTNHMHYDCNIRQYGDVAISFRLFSNQAGHQWPVRWNRDTAISLAFEMAESVRWIADALCPSMSSHLDELLDRRPGWHHVHLDTDRERHKEKHKFFTGHADWLQPQRETVHPHAKNAMWAALKLHQTWGDDQTLWDPLVAVYHYCKKLYGLEPTSPDLHPDTLDKYTQLKTLRATHREWLLQYYLGER